MDDSNHDDVMFLSHSICTRIYLNFKFSYFFYYKYTMRANISIFKLKTKKVFIYLIIRIV
jgi:hypothetical protein